LPDWPTNVTLLALENWGRFSELTFVEVPGADSPGQDAGSASGDLGDQPPRRWLLTTELGTVHHGCGGGGGTPGTDRLHAWHSTIAPSLPDDAAAVEVQAMAPWASTHTTIDFSQHPFARQHARLEELDLDADVDPSCSSCGLPTPEEATDLESDREMEEPRPPEPEVCAAPSRGPRPVCDTCRSTRRTVLEAKQPVRPQPDRVLAIGAQLGPVFGSELVIPTVAVWSTWFDLSVVGIDTGVWGRSLSGDSRWSAHDDQGRRYVGVSVAGSAGTGLLRHDLTFVPALMPDANALTVTIPASFDGQRRQATLDLGSAL
jgi:hypothetical protein